jgi:hypothetical protein
MKVIGFDDREYSLSLDKKIRGNASSLHKRARTVLKELFKFDIIFEEVLLLGSKTAKNKDLYLDFLIPTQMLGIEVQGEQHTQYIPLFHGSKADFIRAKARDVIKREYCIMNSIDLIELPYDESDDQWKERINSR